MRTVCNIDKGKDVESLREVLIRIPGDVQRTQVEIGETEVTVRTQNNLRGKFGHTRNRTSLSRRASSRFFCSVISTMTPLTRRCGFH